MRAPNLLKGKELGDFPKSVFCRGETCEFVNTPTPFGPSPTPTATTRPTANLAPLNGLGVEGLGIDGLGVGTCTNGQWPEGQWGVGGFGKMKTEWT